MGTFLLMYNSLGRICTMSSKLYIPPFLLLGTFRSSDLRKDPCIINCGEPSPLRKPLPSKNLECNGLSRVTKILAFSSITLKVDGIITKFCQLRILMELWSEGKLKFKKLLSPIFKTCFLLLIPAVTSLMLI